jgi:hypothetical protein
MISQDIILFFGIPQQNSDLYVFPCIKFEDLMIIFGQKILMLGLYFHKTS